MKFMRYWMNVRVVSGWYFQRLIFCGHLPNAGGLHRIAAYVRKKGFVGLRLSFLPSLRFRSGPSEPSVAP